MKPVFFLCLLLLLSPFAEAQKKTKGKKSEKEPLATGYDLPEPEADTARRFTGIIKYSIRTDDPSERDSMFLVFGLDQIGVVMFTPGYRADQVIEQHLIARFSDNSLLVLEPRNKTYKVESLDSRNAGTEFMLLHNKKTANILGVACPEYKGEMKLADGESFEAACLVSNQHQFIAKMDYHFLNIQPVVWGYRIVLGWRTRSSDNESTYIMAYRMEPGPVEGFFDLTAYTRK